ncbi:hypothetical protein ACSQ67_011424 [Phaseolus vulgaris]
MDFYGKGVSAEGNNNNGGVGGSNLRLVLYSENKKVCPSTQREFKCGKSLGGHIKVHKKSREPASLPIRRRAIEEGLDPL